MANVDVYPDEPLEKAIKRFKRKVEKEGIIREFRKREYFKKPSTLKREQNIARARKEMKRLMKAKKRNQY